MTVSFVVAEPETLTAVAGDLAGIGSTLQQATTAAAAPTTGVATAAADEVSIAVSQLFGNYGREFQALSAQAAEFHAEFVSLLNGGAAAYLSAEIANAEQNLVPGMGPWAPAAATTGGPYQQLFANTAANLQALGSTWAAHPFPLLRQVIANQRVYLQEIASTLASAIQNFPANLANLPTTIQGGIQQPLSFNPAYYLQQIITAQIGFAQTFATSLNQGITSLVAGLPGFETATRVAFQTLLAGNPTGAVTDLAQAFSQLLVTGVDTSNVTATFDIPTLTLVVTANPVLLGPLGDLFTIMTIPGKEAQFFTDLMPPSILRQMSQNFTNVLNTLTIPSITATVTQPLTAAGTLSTFFGDPLVLTYATVGPTFTTLNAVANSFTAFEQALATGNGAAAVSTLIDAPALAANGFLNGQLIVDAPILVPTGLPASINISPAPLPPVLVPLPQDVLITLHVPFDGILVQPQPLMATISVPNYPPPNPIIAPIPPTNVTIFGTPFSGIVPLLVNQIPEQLAEAIETA
jgi:PE family